MPKFTDHTVKPLLAPALKPGATIGVTAPSSQIDIDRVSRGVHYLEELGFKVILGDTVTKIQDTDYTAAPVDVRVEELHSMFADNSIDAIFTARGGYGTQTLLEHIDYNLIASNPKIIMGFSDATALLNAITKRTKLVTFLGPTVEIVSKDIDEYCIKKAVELLSRTDSWGELKNPGGKIVRRFNEPSRAVSSGYTVGGNMTMMAVTLGTEFEPDTDGKILLVEEVGETPYEIERTLQHLEMCNKFDNCAGLIFGEFSRLSAEKFSGKSEEGQVSVNTILRNHFANRGYPVLADFRFSHGTYNMCIPIGAWARVDSNKRTLSIIDPVLK